MRGFGLWQLVHRHKQQMKKAEMPSGTREVKGPPFTPKPSDVQELIAAITKIEQKEASHVVNQASLRPGKFGVYQRYLTPSLIFACPKRNHEVIATALRVDNKAQSIELIIASNTNVNPSTRTHLQTMWELLRQISTSCHNVHGLRMIKKLHG